jgi:transglutaminase/protease-like cytokinesis protein 3
MDKAVVLFLWITDNIKYDMESFLGNKVTNKLCDPKNILKTGKSVCSGYSSIFRDLAKEIDLKIKNISGYSKGYGYKIG